MTAFASLTRLGMKSAACLTALLLFSRPSKGTDEPDVPATPIIADNVPPPTVPLFTLRFVGDVMFGRYHYDGFHPMFTSDGPDLSGVGDWLKGDLVLFNLETPIVTELPPNIWSPVGNYFGATRDMLASLERVGVTSASLANNHMADLGLEGLLETPNHVEGAGLVPLGRAQPEDTPLHLDKLVLPNVTLEVASVTTLRNFERPPHFPEVPTIPTYQLASRLGPVIAAAPREHFVIVFVHWGQEYDTATGASQRRAAHALVDAGADLIVGHHPHVLQEIEVYQGVLIAYSLGNFLFDSVRPERRVGAILGLDILDTQFCSAQATFIPTEIDSQPTFHPVLASPSVAPKAYRSITRRATRTTRHPQWKQEGAVWKSPLTRPHCGT
jgi:hypothetical protein